MVDGGSRIAHGVVAAGDPGVGAPLLILVTQVAGHLEGFPVVVQRRSGRAHGTQRLAQVVERRRLMGTVTGLAVDGQRLFVVLDLACE